MVHVALLGAASSVHLQRWAAALHGRGRRVSVITQHARQALPLPPGVALHALPWRGAIGYGLNAPALARLVDRLRPDLLHAHYASGYGTLAALAGRHPLLLSVWGSDVYAFPRRSALHGGWLRRTLRAADALASTSAAMADETRRWLRYPAAPIAVTPFGVDLEQFAPARESAPRDGGAPTVGIVKTLAPAYGVDLLLHAFARVRAERDDARLVIVGDGPDRCALEALARRLLPDGAVEFAGAVAHAEVPAWLRRFDVFVAPSRHESFGVAVVEAMACALAVLVSDAGGLPEVVEHERSGIVVPTGDVDALAGAIARLLGDAALRRRLGAAARARAEAHYGWPACVDRMIECQDALLARRPPR